MIQLQLFYSCSGIVFAGRQNIARSQLILRRRCTCDYWRWNLWVSSLFASPGGHLQCEVNPEKIHCCTTNPSTPSRLWPSFACWSYLPIKMPEVPNIPAYYNGEFFLRAFSLSSNNLVLPPWTSCTPTHIRFQDVDHIVWLLTFEDLAQSRTGNMDRVYFLQATILTKNTIFSRLLSQEVNRC